MFDTDGALTWLSLDANDGFPRLVLGIGTGVSGSIIEFTDTHFFAQGSYRIRLDDSDTYVIGGPASHLLEPTGAVLYGAGLLVAVGTMRRRRRS